jgi:hypothetical protein
MIALLVALMSVGADSPDASAPMVIESPRQTSRSVLLVWEKDNPVRTVLSGARWKASTPTGSTHVAVLAAGEGRQKSTAAKIAGTTAKNQGRGCYVRELAQVTSPGRYAYRLYYRTEGQKDGTARLAFDCYVGEERKYTGLVSRVLPTTEDWSEVTGTFELPSDVRLTRVLLYQNGQGTTWYDDVQLCRLPSSDNLLDQGDFESSHHWKVFWRKQGETSWTPVEAVVRERFHNVILLDPDTAYEFKVQQVSANRRVEAESQVLAARTRPSDDRVWQGLRVLPDRVMPTPAAIYPCIESVGQKLYYCESRGGALWLAELDDQFQPRWIKPWVEPHRVDGKSCYQGQTQTAVLGDTLYVSWKRAHHGDAPHARQCIASYDTRTGKIGKPFVLEPEQPEESTWNGGIAAVGDQLWVSYCRWRKAEKGQRTTVTVRRLDYEAGTLGPAFELDPQPTDTPYTPFLSVWNNELVVCFTDSQAKTDQQPLWLVRFDGQRFHDLMTISPRGFNQYAKGVEWGEKLVLVWKYGAPYPSDIYGRYMFHDIGLALVDPAAKRVELTSLIDDLKYNSSPDITVHNGGLVYVYNKFEHVYGTPDDPAKLFGSFLGELQPVAKP